MRRILASLLFCALVVVGCSEDDDSAPTGPLAPIGFVDPVWEYPRSQGTSVTGGYVYRGSELTALAGRYVYGDFGSGRIWGLDVDAPSGPDNDLLVASGLSITSFGVGFDDALYVLEYGPAKRLQRLVGTTDGLSGIWDYDVEPVFDWTFNYPLDLRHAGDRRLFVVEQSGRIMVFDPDDTMNEPTTFLNLTNRITFDEELGLLGLAFHPNYQTNGTFFVYYTSGSGPWTSHLVRYQVSADPDVADASSAEELLTFGQDFANHNGGGLAFDGKGYLLLSVGDEGSSGDPKNNAQDSRNLYGTIVRLDVDVAGAYGIPSDNPFADGTGGAPEVFAYGLRNPWRISYDALDDRIWAGDVGQGTTEEIDLIVAGGNYGWDCKEGSAPFTGEASPFCFERVE